MFLTFYSSKQLEPSLVCFYTLFTEYCLLFHNKNMVPLRNFELCQTNLTFAEPIRSIFNEGEMK